MAIFGFNIPVENTRQEIGVLERIVSKFLKRDEEKEIFEVFLNTETSNGKLISELVFALEEESLNNLAEGIQIDKPLLFEFLKASLKERKIGNLSAYDYLVRKLIEKEEPKFTKLHALIDKGKLAGKPPLKYPGLNKRASGLLDAKIKDSVDDRVKLEYLRHKLVLGKIRGLTKEMFYARNKLNLQNGELVRYLGLLFELNKFQSFPPEKENILKQRLSDALSKKEALDLIYIKSLRYTYPEGKRLEVLDHLNRAGREGLRGEKRIYFSELLILERLRHLIEIFKFYGVDTNLTILVADNDLDILFPNGNSFVPEEDVKRAKGAVRKYIQNLKCEAESLTEKTYLLTNFLENLGIKSQYQNKVDLVYRDAKGLNLLIRSTDLEERVNYRYEFFSGIYGKNYSRGDAREAMCNQIAQTMALSVVFESFIGIPIVLMDNRGLENRLVGGINPDSRAIFLTKLKEPTIIKES